MDGPIGITLPVPDEIMKLIACTAMLLLGCTFYSVEPAQQKTNAELEAERQKEIEECEVPDRVKPKTDIKRVSLLCGRALSVPKPSYSEEAKSKGVAGTVVVDIVTNEEGRVIWAKAVSGPPLLQRVSQQAACRVRYTPTIVSGKAIQTEGSIQYHFLFP